MKTSENHRKPRTLRRILDRNSHSRAFSSIFTCRAPHRGAVEVAATVNSATGAPLSSVTTTERSSAIRHLEL